MKILHVESGRHLYGGALQVVFLLRGLQARGDENLLACPPGSAIAEAAGPYARVHEIPMGGDLDLKLVRHLRRLIRSERPDLIHLHSRRGSDLWGGIAARLEGTPVVLSRRVDNPEPRWLVRIKYRLYGRVITISERIRDVLIGEGVEPARTVCVHSAVDTEQYRPGCPHRSEFLDRFGLAADERVVAMAAQFIPRKGHRTLLDALPEILCRHPRARFLLFGRGPQKERIGRLVRERDLQDRVVLAGFADDLHRVLPCVDLLVHPASLEGLGVVLLQASACGVPIVAAHAGGIPEVVRHGTNGMLVEPGDSAGLAQAVTRLLDEPDLRTAYGTAGVCIAREHFSLAAMAAGNRRVYLDVLNSCS